MLRRIGWGDFRGASIRRTLTIRNMVRSINEVVTVKEGGLIELHATDVPVGTRARVTVIFDDSTLDAVPPATRMADLFGAGKSFDSAEEVDRFIRKERDSWED